MATATTTQVHKGFPIVCPKCNAEDTIVVQVNDVATLTCTSCEEEVQADDVKAIIAKWTRLLAWLDTAPAYDAE